MDVQIDWKAILFGTTTAFGTFLVLGSILIPLVPADFEAVSAPRILTTNVGVLLYSVFLLPGAFVAGYLRAPRIVSAVLYGTAANALGVLLPVLAAIFLLTAGIALLTGVYQTFVTVAFIFSLYLPVITAVVIVAGALGGVIGTLFGRRRTR